MIGMKAKKYVSVKVAKNMREGYKPKQAVAIAYSQARAKGYKVPVLAKRVLRKRR